MEVELLRFPHKRLRSVAIKQYMEKAGYRKAVCFSCGNAAQELARAGVDVLHIGPNGVLEPRRWFTQAEIANCFREYFDATSGHLPAELLKVLAKIYRGYLGEIGDGRIYVPTGSGETLVCLKLAYPDKKFVAVYNLDASTEYNEAAPLNDLVRVLADEVVFYHE